jgi:hypothetical protein
MVCLFNENAARKLSLVQNKSIRKKNYNKLKVRVVKNQQQKSGDVYNET